MASRLCSTRIWELSSIVWWSVLSYICWGKSGCSTPLSIAEGMTFGSLVSATDPVTTLVVLEKFQVEKNLFGIILAVSILDDAVAVLIFDLCNNLIGSGSVSVERCFLLIAEFIAKFFGSLLFGYVSGVGFAWIMKRLSDRTPEDRPSQRFCLLLLFTYLTFFVAEAAWLSGIISVLYSAIYWKQCRSTGSDEEQTHREAQQKAVIAGFAMTSESLTFYLIGLSLFAHPLKTEGDWAFFGWSFFACLIGRALQVYPLAFVINRLSRHNEIEKPEIPDEERIDDLEEQEEEEVRLRPRGNSLLLPFASHSEDCRPFSRQAMKTLLCPDPTSSIPLPLGYQHMILLAGLRGPIAYSTAQLFNNAGGHLNLIAGTTAMTVVFTTFLFGSLTAPALHWFRIPGAQSSDCVVEEDRREGGPSRRISTSLSDIEIVAMRGSKPPTREVDNDSDRSFDRVTEEFQKIVASISEETINRK